jgi:aminopeptidase
MSDFDTLLRKYADLIIHIGVQLRAGQRLLMTDLSVSSGVGLHAVPLVRELAASAYRAGARFVDVQFADEQMHAIRYQHASRDSFDEYPYWLAKTAYEYAERGDAVLSVGGVNPDLLRGFDSALVTAAQKARVTHINPYRELLTRNNMNWTALRAASAGWAASVFPDTEPAVQISRLWDAIFKACRADQDDPAGAWQRHIAALRRRCDYLNEKRYTALKYSGPGTDLTIGLVDNHVWRGGQGVTSGGHTFVPNVPTEEVFSMPHRERVDGTLRATMPLSYSGVLIEGFALTFAGGRVVDVTAARHLDVLRSIIDIDEGAARLGEVALVPHSSPISQSGVLFYDTLYDENAACHVALGAALHMNLRDSDALPDDAFIAAGGNVSKTHVDFMVGSARLDIDGVLRDGRTEPVLRGGEWAVAL